MTFVSITLALCFSPQIFAQSVKTIKICDKNVAPIVISTKGTVLDFPSEPEKVILGTKGAFSIEYIRTDLAISPLNMQAKSNLFVYLQGRRFALDLSTSSMGTSLFYIKDCDEEKLRAPKNGK